MAAEIMIFEQIKQGIEEKEDIIDEIITLSIMDDCESESSEGARPPVSEQTAKHVARRCITIHQKGCRNYLKTIL